MAYDSGATNTSATPETADAEAVPNQRTEARGYTDDELLKLVNDERRRSIGFDQDAFLTADRQRALSYIKGEMPDVLSLPNRSKAVSTDISDAVHTALPDLIEIFTGGDDVAAFTPQNQQDEDAAQQETDYVNHVVFHENDGFMLLYSMFYDALVEKTGLVTWYWGEDVQTAEERFEGKTVVELMMAQKDGEISEQKESGQDAMLGPLYDFTLTRKKDRSTVKIMSVSPDDFTVAADTIHLNDTTYCAMRSRPRAQELIDQGFDPAIVATLPNYGTDKNTAVEVSRDTAGEHSQGNPDITGGPGDLRVVELVTHFIRLFDQGEMCTYRVVTGGLETILLEAEKVNRINFAAITPYPITHRFYGRALADLLIEIQRIKTALLRMALDSGYFALNQRLQVVESGIGANTISDLLRNEPGMPIRVKAAETVTPIQSGGLAFDAFEALEYVSTAAEQRTGIVRNAQGLNPDTLHDTAKGAMALMSAAQKRVRLIARIFAETGIKDLFLGVHAMIRENATAPRIARLKGQWVQVDPSTWAERNDMTIEVGLGASGREFELAAYNQISADMQAIITVQGGTQGPIVTSENVYELAKRKWSKLGIKAPEMFLTDPATQPPPQQGQQVDPKLMQVQLQHEAQMQKQASDAQLAQAKLEGELALKRYEIDQRTKTAIVTESMKPDPAPRILA